MALPVIPDAAPPAINGTAATSAPSGVEIAGRGSGSFPGARRSMAAWYILTSALLFGTSTILAKIAYAHAVTPLTLLSLRATFGGLVVWAGSLIAKRDIGVRKPLRFPLLAIGLTIVPFQVLAYFYALSILPASSASVIANSAPVHVAWMGWLFLGEPLRAADAVILVAVVAGAALVAGQTPSGGHALGLAALGAGTLGYAFYLVALRRLVRGVPPLGVLSIVLPSSAAVYWGAGLATKQLQLSLSTPALIAVAGSTLGGVLGSFLVLLGLRVTPAARTAVLGMLEPVVVVVLSMALLGDVMTWLRAVGIVIVVTGIAALHLRHS